MTGRMRAQHGRGGRSARGRGGKSSRAQPRNITRWSANKDIALLCALTKECRKDKFRISWDRVARWIGPNVTGGAIEQHVAKLYSKLKDHRTSLEPKRKKRKGANNVEDDNNEGDFVEDEDIWNRGNEAFANIFYANPDTSSGIQDEDANYDFEGDARAGDYYHKEPVANYGGDYEEEGDWHSQLVQASQGYGGTTGGQSYPTEYDAFDSLGQGMPAIPSPYGYANSSAGNSIPNYGNNYMQQSGPAYQSNHLFNQGSPGSPEQLGQLFNGNFQGNIDPMVLPQRQRSGMAYQNTQAISAGVNINNMNQANSFVLGTGQRSHQNGWNMTNTNSATSPSYQGYSPAQPLPLGSHPDFSTTQGPIFNAGGQYQNKFISDNMDHTMNQMTQAQTHAHPNIRGSFSDNNKTAAAKPRNSKSSRAVVKEEFGWDHTDSGNIGQGQFTGIAPAKAPRRSSKQSKVPEIPSSQMTTQYWIDESKRQRGQSASGTQGGLLQPDLGLTFDAPATTSATLPSAQAHTGDQVEGGQEFNLYADQDPGFFNAFMNDDDEFKRE